MCGVCGGGGVCVCVSRGVCVCVWVRERERESFCVHACVCEYVMHISCCPLCVVRIGG